MIECNKILSCKFFCDFFFLNNVFFIFKLIFVWKFLSVFNFTSWEKKQNKENFFLPELITVFNLHYFCWYLSLAFNHFVLFFLIFIYIYISILLSACLFIRYQGPSRWVTPFLPSLYIFASVIIYVALLLLVLLVLFSFFFLSIFSLALYKSC